MSYRFLPPALVEAREAAEFYEGRIPGLGADFLAELDAAIERILLFPEAWGRLGADHRRCSLRRFPYWIVYHLLSGGEVVIVSVFHHSREPQSWRENL